VRGFTLIEVLVALAIVALALLAAVRASGSLAQTNAELRLRLLAQLSADNRIAELRAAGAFPPIGVRTSECPQGTAPLECVEDVKSTPNPLFRRIEVRVYAKGERQVLAELVGILPQRR
jgi:general secretion pathway protein I